MQKRGKMKRYELSKKEKEILCNAKSDIYGHSNLLIILKDRAPPHVDIFPSAPVSKPDMPK